MDDKQKLLKVFGESKIIESIQAKEITPDKSELMNDTLSVSVIDDDKIRDAAFMAVRENGSSFSMYKITADSDPRGRLNFSGVSFAVDELSAYIVTDMRPKDKSFKQVAEQILGYTNGEWRVGFVDSTLPALSGTFYYLSVRDALKQLQTFGCEILFKCTITGNKVTDKWIEIYKQIGVVSNKRFVYGSNALEVVRQRDRSQLYTSIIGRGKGEEVGDGYGRRIEFTDVEWKKSSGDPLDKPKGQNWLEYPEMTALYGIPMKNGSKRKRETVLILEDIEDPAELLQATYENLVEYSRPLIQFKTSILGGDAIGNIVPIHRSDKGYHYKTRVFSMKLDRVTGKVECGLGDNLNSSSTRQAASIQNSVANLAETKMTFYDSTEISKWQSDIIRGAHGGAVILMSPSDYPANHPQRGESRQPFQMVWMDGDSIQTSSHFLVANSDGIGFIDGDFYTSPFKTAWTIDGKFNANFIKVGKIIAEVFETSFNDLGDTLKIVSGALQIHNDGKKIMELTKKGMQFWSKSGEIGTIGTTDSAGNPFPDAQTPTPIEENALVIRANGSGKYILISPTTGKGFVMLGNGTTFHIGDLNVYGKLRINGQEVYPGQGGGPSNPGDWDGNYPPEVTTSADKFAWELWVFLLSKGYSKASIAGILGNVQGEVGAGMNPDTAQVGGPAYGIVQWDGSAYPLVGPATYDGRTYVTNLFNAAGITEAISSMAGQAKLLDWCMYNGQWLGRVNPTSVSGFKTMTDPQAAAYTFEENFERPATAHPERQGWAQAWYDKFKDLEVAKPNNDIVSIARSWLGWFYYVQLHPSSDLGNLNNPNKSGGTDCSGFVWLVLNKAGYRVPANMQWYTGSMASDARGSHSWLTEISASQSRAGDIVIYNQGDGAGNNGHTAILLEPYKGNDTQIIEMGGDSRYTGVNISTIGYAFGSLLNGDRCLARAVK
ncbi:minor structural protein 3 [Enterococcus asini]|nr:minor structural protein 3 [Enterococcus asini]